MKNSKLLLPLCGLAIATAFSACTKSLTKPTSLSGVNATNGTPVDYTDSLKRGLWAYYMFNDNLADSSGNNRNMSGVNGIGFTTDIDGSANDALNFTGVNISGENTYAVCDSGINFTSTTWSVTFLMYTRATTGRLFEKADFNNAQGASISFDTQPDSLTGIDLHLEVTTDSNICNDITTSANSNFLSMTNPIALDTWAYVTITYDGSIEKIYVNGEVMTSLTTATNQFHTCDNAPFYVGMWWLEDLQPFNGIMDDLRIYTRALTLGEVQYLASSEGSGL